MTEKERASCINTIEALRRAVFNANGMLNAIDAVNCEKIIAMLKHLEPCDDAVSRADVIDMLEMYPFTEYGEYESARETVKRLPSVKPKRKKGKWIPRESIFGGPDEKVYTCNQCGHNIGFRAEKFCPHCGSYNGGERDE